MRFPKKIRFSLSWATHRDDMNQICLLACAIDFPLFPRLFSLTFRQSLNLKHQYLANPATHLDAICLEGFQIKDVFLLMNDKNSLLFSKKEGILPTL